MMFARCYDICLYTTIGERHGTMRIECSGTRIRGTLNLWEHTEDTIMLTVKKDNDEMELTGKVQASII